MAEELVTLELAACVNILPCLRSIYRWKGGRVCEDTEYLLLIKTPARLTASVEEAIMALHTYELPEIMALPVDAAEEVTHRWVIEGVRPASDHSADEH